MQRAQRDGEEETRLGKRGERGGSVCTEICKYRLAYRALMKGLRDTGTGQPEVAAATMISSKKKKAAVSQRGPLGHRAAKGRVKGMSLLYVPGRNKQHSSFLA